jgi:hypothetical protein
MPPGGILIFPGETLFFPGGICAAPGKGMMLAEKVP